MILELRLSIHLHIQQVYFKTGLIILKLKAVDLGEIHIDCILGNALREALQLEWCSNVSQFVILEKWSMA
jgi:hypothetical protein